MSCWLKSVFMEVWASQNSRWCDVVCTCPGLTRCPFSHDLIYKQLCAWGQAMFCWTLFHSINMHQISSCAFFCNCEIVFWLVFMCCCLVDTTSWAFENCSLMIGEITRLLNCPYYSFSDIIFLVVYNAAAFCDC